MIEVKVAKDIVNKDGVASSMLAKNISSSGSTNIDVQQDEETIDRPYIFFHKPDYWNLQFGVRGMSSILKACEKLGFGLNTLSYPNMLKEIKARIVGSVVDEGKVAKDS